jgi:hypothetical protein
LSATCRFKHAASRYADLQNISLKSGDAINMSLAARCPSPFTKKMSFPPATLISTLRIVKERCDFRKSQTSKSGHNLLCTRLSGLLSCCASDVHCTWPLTFTVRPQGKWWRMTGSNRRPPACKAGALPAELIPQSFPSNRPSLLARFA